MLCDLAKKRYCNYTILSFEKRIERAAIELTFVVNNIHTSNL